MKYFVLIAILTACCVTGYTQSSITKIDFVKITGGKKNEALYFYENNWKVFRDIALDKGYIKSYELLIAVTDSISNFDLMLITEYADSIHEKLSEERFQQIIKETRPFGPKLLNTLKPNEFRQNLYLKTAQTLFTSDVKAP